MANARALSGFVYKETRTQVPGLDGGGGALGLEGKKTKNVEAYIDGFSTSFGDEILAEVNAIADMRNELERKYGDYFRCTPQRDMVCDYYVSVDSRYSLVSCHGIVKCRIPVTDKAPKK